MGGKDGASASGAAAGTKTNKTPVSSPQDIFQLHKDLLDVIKNRPDDGLSVPISLVDKQRNDMNMLDTIDSKNPAENIGMLSPKDTGDKTQDLTEITLIQNQKAWDASAPDSSKIDYSTMAKKPAQEETKKKEEFSVNYFDKDLGLNS